jgi:hypothetical protein
MEVFTSVATSPYHFYFVFVPRIASNRKKVRFGEVAIQKLILYSVLPPKKIMLSARMSY